MMGRIPKSSLGATPLGLLVGNLDLQTTRDQLMEYFSTFGQLSNSFMVQCPSLHGIWSAYVEYSDSNITRTVLDAASHSINNKMVTVSPVSPEAARGLLQANNAERQLRSLMLKNLPLHVQKTEINEALQEFGTVEQISKLRRSNPQSMFCYITMQNAQDARSLQEKGYFMFRGRRKIRVEMFAPKDARGTKHDGLEGLKAATADPPFPQIELAVSESQAIRSSGVQEFEAQSLHGNSSPSLSRLPNTDLVAFVGSANSKSGFEASTRVRIKPGLELPLNPEGRTPLSQLALGAWTWVPPGQQLTATSLDDVLDPNHNLRFNLQSEWSVLPRNHGSLI